MRFLQRLTEANIPPNKVPRFDEFWNYWKTEMYEIMDDPSEFTPAHLQALVDRINAVDLNNIYRGILVGEEYLDNLKPGMPLGCHWTWNRDVAASFSTGGNMGVSHDDRFEDYMESIYGKPHYNVLFHGACSPDAINIFYTLGQSIDEFEDELDLASEEPIRLHSVSIAKAPGGRRPGEFVTHTNFAGLYTT